MITNNHTGTENHWVSLMLARFWKKLFIPVIPYLKLKENGINKRVCLICRSEQEYLPGKHFGCGKWIRVGKTNWHECQCNESLF